MQSVLDDIQELLLISYVSWMFALCCVLYQGFPGGAGGMREAWIPSLGREDPLELSWLLFRCSVVSHPLEQAMAAHSGILACEIPRTEERGRLQSIGLDMTE